MTDRRLGPGSEEDANVYNEEVDCKYDDFEGAKSARVCVAVSDTASAEDVNMGELNEEADNGDRVDPKLVPTVDGEVIVVVVCLILNTPSVVVRRLVKGVPISIVPEPDSVDRIIVVVVAWLVSDTSAAEAALLVKGVTVVTLAEVDSEDRGVVVVKRLVLDTPFVVVM